MAPNPSTSSPPLKIETADESGAKKIADRKQIHEWVHLTLFKQLKLLIFEYFFKYIMG